MSAEASRDFYMGEGLALDGRVVAAGAVAVEHCLITVHPPERYDSGFHERYLANLEQLNDSCRVVEHEGRAFEIAEANSDMKEEGTRVTASTSTSSLTENIGNRQEAAMEAALNPDRHFVYIASPGNGGSSYYDDREKRYWKHTGRLTYEDDDGVSVALPLVDTCARYLKTLDIQSVELSGDSQGATIATALGVAFRGIKTEATGLFMNGRPGLCNARALKLIGGMIFREPLAGAVFRAHGLDINGVTKISSALAKKHTPKIDALSEMANVRRKSYGDLLTDLKAMAHGPSNGNPAVHDTLAFLRHQPGANLMVVAGTSDPLYSTPSQEADFDRFMDTIAPANNDREGELAMTTPSMPHSWHTHLPQIYQGMKDYTFRR